MKGLAVDFDKRNHERGRADEHEQNNKEHKIRKPVSHKNQKPGCQKDQKLARGDRAEDFVFNINKLRDNKLLHTVMFFPFIVSQMGARRKRRGAESVLRGGNGGTGYTASVLPNAASARMSSFARVSEEDDACAKAAIGASCSNEERMRSW